LVTACGKGQASAKASAPPSSVQVQTLQTKVLEDSTEYVGTLQAAQTIQLVPQIQGRIRQVLVNPGAQVKQGDPIFLLDPDVTLPQVKSAQATVSANIAARNTAAKQLQAAEAGLTSAQAQYQLAQVNNARYQYLAQQGAIDRATAQQYATTVRVDLAAVNQNQAQVNAARAALAQADENVRKAQADLQTAQVSLNFKTVAAPISGTVADFTLKKGDYVTSGQVLTTINQNEFFDLQIPIPINRAKQLRVGLPVQLLDPTTGEQLSSGNIYFVSPQTNANAQSISTKARFPNANGRLRDSQYVKGRVIWSTTPGVLVPTVAVTPIGAQNFVFVAQERMVNGKNQMVAHQVPVTTGQIQGQSYQVLRGLKPGDKVIVSGILRLKEGSPITPQTGGSSG
jgi:RND family efflux transporter MFP subunit